MDTVCVRTLCETLLTDDEDEVRIGFGDEPPPTTTRTKTNFLGCFAADKLPDPPTIYPAALVVNVDSSVLPGSHWIGLFLPAIYVVEYFDSLGCTFYVHPLFVHYIRTVLRARVIRQNMNLIQPPEGESCGIFCAYFLLRRHQGIEFFPLLNEISRGGNLKLNELDCCAYTLEMACGNKKKCEMSKINSRMSKFK